MKRCVAIVAIVVALGFAAAGCSSGPEGGGGERKGFPTSANWGPVMAPRIYKADDASFETYVDTSMKTQLLENGFDHLLVKVYVEKTWSNEEGKPIQKSIMVEMYFHKMEVGAEKTFQEWHSGISLNDMGEKAYADNDAIVFLRGAVVVRVRPRGPWLPKTGRGPAIEVATAIDDWMQGK